MFQIQTYKGVSKGWTPVARRSSATDAERFQRLLSSVRPEYYHRVQQISPAQPARPLWGLTRRDWADIGHSMAVIGAVYGVVLGASLAVHIIVPGPDTAQHVLTVEE